MWIRSFAKSAPWPIDGRAVVQTVFANPPEQKLSGRISRSIRYLFNS